MSGALRALTVTLAIEVPWVALCFPGRRRRLALVALVANIATNLALNVLLPRLAPSATHRILIGELAAVVVEALAYAAAAGPGSFGRALVVSGVGNALSFELGGALASLAFG